MEKLVELIYSPFSQAARLYWNNQALCPTRSKLEQFVIGKPMDRWLEPVTVGYQCWNGFLPELVVEINEDVFTLSFSGTRKNFQRFCATIHKQEATLDLIGFVPGGITLQHIEKYEPLQMRDALRELRTHWMLNVPTQKLLIVRDRLDERLEAIDETANPDDVWELIDDYVKFVTETLHQTNTSTQKAEVQAIRTQLEAIGK